MGMDPWNLRDRPVMSHINKCYCTFMELAEDKKRILVCYLVVYAFRSKMMLRSIVERRVSKTWATLLMSLEEKKKPTCCCEHAGDEVYKVDGHTL